jgi:TetR/AcrR family transcriptional regulator, regulator of biofilm formation and stress response
MARVGAELRRRDFVEATVKVIAEHGAAGATTRRIAAEAGCPLASLHYVFHTKEDLFYAVYESLLEEMNNLASHEAKEPHLLRDAAPAQFRRLMRWLGENPVFARAQFELYSWSLRCNPEFAARAYALTLDQARSAFGGASDASGNARLVEATARLSLILGDGILAAWFGQNDARQMAADTESACRTLSLFVDGWVPAVPKRRSGAKVTA